MKDDNLLDRIEDPRMEYYRTIYKDSPRWDGNQIIGQKKVIVYCEQGLGDIIQAARYFQPLRSFGCKIILHAQEELKTLFLSQKYIDGFICKGDDELPEHDYHVLSLSLPFLMSGAKRRDPYLLIPDKNEEIASEFKDYIKVGITWEGTTRSCPLRLFKTLAKNKDVRLFMTQKEIRNKRLVDDCDDLELFGSEINDMLDTAKIINAMDYMVSVDTCALHLSGALNKKTFGIIDQDGDPRWNSGILYPSISLLKSDGDNLESIMKTILKHM